jgi:outer membrane protein OmpA-like peptidoglycan-associated protein
MPFRSSNPRSRCCSTLACVIPILFAFQTIGLAPPAVAQEFAQLTREPTTFRPGQTWYAVEGVTLGARVVIDDPAYREWQCVPSTQFAGFTWCTKSRNSSEPRGIFKVSSSMLHAADGTVVYVNRSQSPAYWGTTEVDEDIQRYSRRIGTQPNIIEMPTRAGLPKGTLATWGKVSLHPLDAHTLDALGQGKPVQKGLLVDFLGDFFRSAREGLPVYQITGGAGFVWVASYDTNGGFLRSAAVDASRYSPPAPVLQEPPSKRPPSAGYAHVTAEALDKSQAIRDDLFKELKAQNTHYNFDYVVINLPPGKLAGLNISVPVTHIRYSSTIFFAFDRYSLQPGAEAVISDFAKTLLKDNSYKSVVIVGHTDGIGTVEYNETLSKNRAVTVAAALRASGIPEQSLGIVPMGKAQPFTTNSTPQGRASNRRVEFFISNVPGAPEAIIPEIPFNRCHITDYERPGEPGSDCPPGPTRIPVLHPSGEGRPQATLDLTRGGLATTPGIREPLPNDVLMRPSIRELQSE